MANRKCLIVFLFYGPGDAIARVSRSSMVALHTLLSCVLKCQMQFTAIVPDHVDPSFLLSSPLPGSMYLAVVCYLGVSFSLHPIQMSKVSQPLVPYYVYYSHRAETWRQIWGDGDKNFADQNISMILFKRKISILTPKMSDDLFLVIYCIFLSFCLSLLSDM